MRILLGNTLLLWFRCDVRGHAVCTLTLEPYFGDLGVLRLIRVNGPVIRGTCNNVFVKRNDNLLELHHKKLLIFDCPILGEEAGRAWADGN